MRKYSYLSPVHSAPGTRWHSGRTLPAVIAYLLGFAILLWIVLHFFLAPVAKAASAANDLERKRLQAIAWLMLSVLIFYLVAGLMLTFRIGRFFFPRSHERRVRTQHIDIWAEAGKRLGEKKEE